MNPPQDDLDALMGVMEAAFEPRYGEAWNRRQVEDALILGNCHYLLGNKAGEAPQPGEVVAGFSLSRMGYEEEELLLFAVSPAFRGQGAGAKLLARFASAAKLRGAKRLLLEMRDGNPAERLYRGFGFKPIGRRANYYNPRSGPRIDAITFARDFD